MSKLSAAVCALTAFFPKAESTLLSSRHRGKNRVTGSLCLHLPVRQVSFQGIVRRSEIGNAARAVEAGRLNLCANVSSWKQSDTRRQTQALIYLGENVRLRTQHSPSVTGGAGAAAAASPVLGGSREDGGLLARRRWAEGAVGGGKQSIGSEQAEERCSESVKGKKNLANLRTSNLVSFFLSKTMLLNVFLCRSVIFVSCF